MCSQEDLLTENEKYVVSYLLSGQGPGFSLSCPALLILVYWSTGEKRPIVLPWVPIYLLPQKCLYSNHLININFANTLVIVTKYSNCQFLILFLENFTLVFGKM